MDINRRNFFKIGTLLVSGGTLLAAPGENQEEGKKEGKAVPEKQSAHTGCLVDTTLCIGCRKCEEACNRRNKLPRPDTPYTDRTVFKSPRRPSKDAFTVVNQYEGSPSPDQPRIKTTQCKIQCMHCLTPACVSACVVGAMTKGSDGSVLYNKGICLGCRYCMVACPFEILAYEYSEPLVPRVRKCRFCADGETLTGAQPACVNACPVEALVLGKRQELLTLARHRIEKRPDRYINYIYGEKEAGGTSWLYLAGRPHRGIGLPEVPAESPAVLTESIQHGIFKYGILPVAAYGILGAVMWRNRKKQKEREDPPTVKEAAAGGTAAEPGPGGEQ